MHDQAPREEAVTHHVLKHVTPSDASHHQRARNQRGGVVDIVLREEQRLRLAGGSTGGVQPHRFFRSDGQHTVGIDCSEVRPRREGQPSHIVERLDLFRLNACFLKLLLIERHLRGYSFYRVLQLR